MSFIDVTVGSRLRREREALGRSVAEQARAIGIGEEQLDALEDGTERVSAIELRAFCESLGLSPADVYSDVLAHKEPPVSQAAARAP